MVFLCVFVCGEIRFGMFIVLVFHCCFYCVIWEILLFSFFVFRFGFVVVTVVLFLLVLVIGWLYCFGSSGLLASSC